MHVTAVQLDRHARGARGGAAGVDAGGNNCRRTTHGAGIDPHGVRGPAGTVDERATAEGDVVVRAVEAQTAGNLSTRGARTIDRLAGEVAAGRVHGRRARI